LIPRFVFWKPFNSVYIIPLFAHVFTHCAHGFLVSSSMPGTEFYFYFGINSKFQLAHNEIHLKSTWTRPTCIISPLSSFIYTFVFSLKLRWTRLCSFAIRRQFPTFEHVCVGDSADVFTLHISMMDMTSKMVPIPVAHEVVSGNRTCQRKNTL
jgi:hypothetical protein